MSIKNILVAKESVLDYMVWEMPPEVQDALPRGTEVVSVYRSRDALVENLQDYSNMPFTNEHPWEPVTAKDKSPICGMTDSAKASTKGVKVNLTVFDANCIIDIETEARREVSLGYDAEFHVESGTHEGKAYQVALTDIKPNHFALTERGRCGPDCVINDSNSVCDCETCKSKLKSKEDIDMNDTVKNKSIALNDAVISVAPESEPLINKAFTELKDSVTDLTGQVETLTGERDTLRQQLADTEAKYTPEKILEMVNDAATLRTGIMSKAAVYLDDAAIAELSTKDNKQIMLDTLAAAGIEGLEDKGDAHIEGAFSVLADKKADDKNDKSTGSVGDKLTPRADKADNTVDLSDDDKLAAAREKYRSGGRS